MRVSKIARPFGTPLKKTWLLLVILAFASVVHAGTPPTSQPATAASKTEKVAYLGVTAKSADDALRTQLGLPDGVGLLITTIDRKGPAGADLKTNDVLQKMDDQVLTDPHQFVTLIRLHQPGDSITLTVIRSAQAHEVTIKLGEKERPVVAEGNNPVQADLPVGPVSVDLTFKDDDFSAYIKTEKDGHKKLIVKDSTGREIASGPIDTPEQWQKFSPEIREHLEVMHKALLEQQGKP